jgi:hypothetical protein
MNYAPPTLGEIASLGRYFTWAQGMRVLFFKTVERAVREKMTIAHRSPEGLDAFQYLSYWLAGLHVVVEGWDELRLRDERVDAILDDSGHRLLLRRFRNGVFHYQPSIFDERFTNVANVSEEILPWCVELTDAFRDAISLELSKARERVQGTKTEPE